MELNDLETESIVAATKEHLLLDSQGHTLFSQNESVVAAIQYSRDEETDFL